MTDDTFSEGKPPAEGNPPPEGKPPIEQSPEAKTADSAPLTAPEVYPDTGPAPGLGPGLGEGPGPGPGPGGPGDAAAGILPPAGPPEREQTSLMVVPTKLLVVDDEESLLRAMRRVMGIELPDVRTFWATTGLQALEIMQRERANATLVDMMLTGGFSGRDTLLEIEKRWPQTVNTVFTGYMDDDEINETVSTCKCFKMLFKPFDDKILINVVKEALAFQKKLMLKETEADRRRAPRLATNLHVMIAILKGMFFGRMLDISMTGARLETDIPLDLGEIVGYDVTLHEVRIKGEGTVVRVFRKGTKYHSGIRFSWFEGSSYGNLRFALQKYLYVA